MCRTSSTFTSVPDDGIPVNVPITTKGLPDMRYNVSKAFVTQQAALGVLPSWLHGVSTTENAYKYFLLMMERNRAQHNNNHRGSRKQFQAPWVTSQPRRSVEICQAESSSSEANRRSEDRDRRELKRLAQTLENVQQDQERLMGIVSDLVDQLATMKNIVEVQRKKIACQLCQTSDKEWVLRCGHSYCATCFEEMKKFQFPDVTPFEDEEGTGRHYLGRQVSLLLKSLKNHLLTPQGCPVCDGTIGGAIQLAHGL